MEPDDPGKPFLTRPPANDSRVPLVLIVFLLSIAPAAGAVDPAVPGGPHSSHEDVPCSCAGRPLVEALRQLQERGLHLIFSSDLVRPDMIVAVEPPVEPPRRILDSLLAPFGLETRDGPAGTILIVRAPGSDGRGRDGGGPIRTDADPRPVPSMPVLRERVKVGAPSEEEPEPRTTLQRSDLQALPSVGEDASRMITYLPGIVAADKSAQFSIRGGGADEALVVLDGLTIEEPVHLKDFLAFSSIVNSSALGRADVMSGIFPAEYGDGLGGVVDLSTLEATGEGRTVVGLSLINAGVVNQGRFGNGAGSWLVSARSWYPDAVLEIVDPGGEDISPTYNDLLAKAQMQLEDGSILTAHVLASKDDLDFRADLGDGTAQAADDHRYTWVDWKKPWSPRLYMQTLASTSTVARSRNGGSLDQAGGSGQVYDSRTYGTFGLKQDWIFTPRDSWSLKWGFDARRMEAEYAYRSHVERPVGGQPLVIDRNLSLEPSGMETGAYLAGRFHVLSALNVEIGVRGDRQSLTSESETSPRVGLSYALGESTLLRAGWGRFHQPQGINELQIEDGVLDYFPAQGAEHREVGVDHLFTSGLKFGATAYLREMTSLRPRYENLFNPFTLFPETEADRVRIAPEGALARGLELNLSLDRGGPLSWRASYALAKAQDRIDDAWVARSRDQRHTLGFTMVYRHGRAWEVSVGGVYHTGWPTTEVGAEQVQNADGSVTIRPILGPLNAARYPPYHRLDLKVTRRIELEGSTLSLYLDVTNLYGRDNICCTSGFAYLPQAGGTVRVDRTDGFFLSQVPVVGLTWEF